MTEKPTLTHSIRPFRKLLIANRGEIAVRILRACRDLGITGVAVFSDVDRASLHVRLADEAYAIGPAPPRESYLCIEKLMDVARKAGCDALHPGYGFLAENPGLPRACAKAGIEFVGPSAAAMELLGSKTAARQLAHQAGVPMVPGVRDPVARLEDAGPIARDIGYPVLLKAVAGGGGKGMRVVAGPAELPAAWRDAASEALNAFGDASVYIERYLERPRHIEMQIFGDTQGNIVYLGERECSVQRRHQKVIEEAPSTFVTPELRRAMGEAAVRLARAAGYTNAGTVEFLVDAQRNFYFLEVNTRLQVEHPVTEAVTGLDLVALQLHVAAGRPLPITQREIGEGAPLVPAPVHAIECRIYAEDPENNFYPSPGQIVSWRAPEGPGVRFDGGVYPGWTVPGDYDPLLGKLITWGANRPEALARMRRALEEFEIGGIRTNADLFIRIINDPEFLRGEIHTRWLDERHSGADKKVERHSGAGMKVERHSGAGMKVERHGGAEIKVERHGGAEIKVERHGGAEIKVERHGGAEIKVERHSGARMEAAAAIAAVLWTLKHSGVSGEAAAVSSDSRWKMEGRREQLARAPERP